MVKNWALTWTWKGRKPLELGCAIYYDRKDYLAIDSSVKHKESDGSFYPARGNSHFIGNIHITMDSGRVRETIIHEAAHAGFETMRHMGKHVTTRYEEQVVDCIGKLATEMLNCIEDCSI